jgi:prepilin-type processing-associated H-X9-DG protein
VFARARENARRASCQSNLKQIGLGVAQYTQDYDETLFPHRTRARNELYDNDVNGQRTAGRITVQDRNFWATLIQPYVKSWQLFQCPSNPEGWVVGSSTACASPGCTGNGYGAQNSYGYNNALAPSERYNNAEGSNIFRPIKLAQFQDTAKTFLAMDATYYGVYPDVANQSGKAPNMDAKVRVSGGGTTVASYVTAGETFYDNYWKNIGNSRYSWNAGNYDNKEENESAPRHLSTINVLYADGHVKTSKWVNTINDSCNWFVPGTFGTYNIDTSACS